MKGANLGDKRSGNAIVDVEDRLGRLELAMRQIPSRFVLRQQAEGKRFDIAQTAHGFTVGTWIARQDAGAWIKADNTLDVPAISPHGNGVEPLALVVRVVDANRVVAVTEGIVYLPDVVYTDWTAYYLSTAGTVTPGSPDDPGGTTWGSKTVRKIVRMTHVALDGGWIWLPGPTLRASHNHHLKNLADVALLDMAPLSGPYQSLLYDDATSLWKIGTPDASLGTRSALSVIGRAANSAGAAADIVGSTTGQVLQVGASSLTFGTLATASYQNGSVTAAKIGSDVVLDTLNDVTIASVAGLNFLRYDAGTSQWKNYNLGPIGYSASVTTLALDGGTNAGGGAPIKVSLGNDTGSRLMIGTASTLEWVLSGDPDAGIEKVARIRRVSSSQVSFYDQGTSTISSGTEVYRWTCSTSAGSRQFDYLVPLAMNGNEFFLKTSAESCSIKGTGTSPVVMTFVAGQLSSVADVFFTGSVSVGVLGSTLFTVRGRSQIGATTDQIAFFGGSPASKTSVGTPSTVATTQTAGASYTSNEQTMLANLKTDVTNLRSTLNSLVVALNSYTLV